MIFGIPSTYQNHNLSQLSINYSFPFNAIFDFADSIEDWNCRQRLGNKSTNNCSTIFSSQGFATRKKNQSLAETMWCTNSNHLLFPNNIYLEKNLKYHYLEKYPSRECKDMRLCMEIITLVFIILNENPKCFRFFPFYSGIYIFRGL